MAASLRGFLRDNAFLVAAVALPIVVAAFFIAASAIPRWTVPPPAYDLVLRSGGRWDGTQARVAVEFVTRDGQVVAIATPQLPNTYLPPTALFLFDHETQRVRELALDLPASLGEGERREVVVASVPGRVVAGGATAPDGYEFRTRSNGGTGLMGDVFGIGRYRQSIALVKDGRVVSIDLPPPYQNPYMAPVSAVAWIDGGGAR